MGGFLEKEPRLELRVEGVEINGDSFGELAACRLVEMMKEAKEEDRREHNFFHGNGSQVDDFTSHSVGHPPLGQMLIG